MGEGSVARYTPSKAELASRNWLSVLGGIATAVGQTEKEVFEIDLSHVTWIGHLPLLALSLGLQLVADAHFRKRIIRMPEWHKVRNFLHRWLFYDLLETYKFQYEGGGPEQTGPPTQSQLATRVLAIHSFSSTEKARELRDDLRRAGTDLRKILRTAQLTDREIHGLADLVVYELCKNAAEHARVKGDAFIFGRFSPKDDEARPVYEKNAAEWETAVLEAMRGKGMTEIVVGDAGEGIITTLREQAAAHGLSSAEDILKWAFQPLSTRKHEGREHTRGLWAVKNKVKELRGVLYCRTADGEGGGLSIAWDFYTDPRFGRPHVSPDSIPFPGTQFQILLPYRIEEEPRTTIEWDRRASAASARDLSPSGFSLPPAPPEDGLGLREKIKGLPEDDVLFIDLSAVKEAWNRQQVETIAREIYEGIHDHYGLVWLLDPSTEVIAELQASRWLRNLWEQYAILVPIVTVSEDQRKPPRIEYVVSDTAAAPAALDTGQPLPRDPGDTLHARRSLLQAIGIAVGGDSFDWQSLDLNDDERSWLDDAFSKNRALVSADGYVVAAFDVEGLAAAATESLLFQHINQLLDARFEQQKRRRAWYLLPSRRYCRHYIGRDIFDQLSAAMSAALDRRLERMIRQTNAQYAVAFTSFAEKELARAHRAGVPALVRLRHYQEQKALDDLRRQIPDGARVVLMILITGSGRTIARLAKALMERNVELTIVCAIDSTTADDRKQMPELARLEAAKAVRSIVQRPVPTLDKEKVPARDAGLPLIVIDPETLLPLPPVSGAADELSDGRFWQFVIESNALSVEPVTYKGIDYTTLFWVRNLSHNRTLYARIVKVLNRVKPDIICLPDDTYAAVTQSFRTKLEKSFPRVKVGTPEEVVAAEKLEGEKPTTADGHETDPFQGKNVAIFAIATSSGGSIGRLLKYFETASQVHVVIVINRIPEGITAAMTRQSKVSVTTFKRIYSASPELRMGSARSIAIRSLDDSRPSCLSNRLLLFVEELRRLHTENLKAAQGPEELPQIMRPIAPPRNLKLEDVSYDFSTPAAIANLKKLIASATALPDMLWLYAILDEAASRAESGLRSVGANRASWRRQYAEYIEELYISVPETGSAAAKSEVLKALLLDRWEWHGVRRDDDPAVEATTLGEALLRDVLSPESPPAFRALCIRAMSKVDRQRLIENLEQIADVARMERQTELSLALELTKILDDSKSAPKLLDRFSEIVAARNAASDTELDVAIDSLMADIGVVRGAHRVDFLPWQSVRKILNEEPPDHDRTVRLLIRAMRGAFGQNARFLYYREVDRGQYIYGDSFPRRSPTNTEPVPEPNLHALDLLKNSVDFYSERLGSDTRPYVRAYLKTPSSTDLHAWGMALYAVTLREGKGIFRVWQNVDQWDTMDPAAVRQMQRAVPDAKKLIERGTSSLGATGVWQYQRTIETLQKHRGDTAEWDPLRDFTERVRALLGGDLASILVLDRTEREWQRRWLVGRSTTAAPVAFPVDAQSRLTVRVARARAPRTFRTRADAIAEGFVESIPAPWAQAWLALPLLHDDRCVAVVHVWHHTPGWFEPYDEQLLQTLADLGGGLAEVAMRYEEARASDTLKLARSGLRSIMPSLINLSLVAESAASEIVGSNSVANVLTRCTRTIQEGLRAIPQLLDVNPEEATTIDVGNLIARAAQDENARTEQPIFFVEAAATIAEVDVPVLRRAVDAIFRSARAKLRPGGRIHAAVTADERDVTIRVRLENPPAQRLIDELVDVESMTPLPLLARVAAERHGGRAERSEYDFGMEIRLIVPISRYAGVS